MRERAAQILKIVCIGLAALLLVQLVKAGFRANPLAGVAIPEVPSLPADTNAPPAVANKTPTKPGTNSPVSATASNMPGTAVNTNDMAHHKAKPAGANATPVASVAESAGTSAIIRSQTNSMVTALDETNAASLNKIQTNSMPVALSSETPVTNNSNVSAMVPVDTNVTTTKLAAGTNIASTESGKTNITNSVTAKATGGKKSPPMPPQMMAMMGGPGGGKAAKLSPEIQARVDRVVESEILAPVNHPMPMALLGIAGKVAFLRSPSGQTGMVKEGEDLGEIKLLHIGINRVLVEQDGQKKELMIFSGLGGESLLPKTTVTSDETTKH